MTVFLKERIEQLLKRISSPSKAKRNASFFKTGKGDYGEGDVFLGITVPEVRKVIKAFEKEVTLEELESVLTSSFHEVRLAGALLYVSLYRIFLKEGEEKQRKNVAKSYVRNAHLFNNWDLVDASASAVLGEEMALCMDEGERERVLKKLIDSDNLWENRIAVIAMHAFIKRNLPELPLSVILRSLFHSHDLMHKANGWMLREIGKHSEKEVLYHFLDAYRETMPRTTLRYALEREERSVREKYMKMKTR